MSEFMDMDERVEKGKALFKSGFNCAQSVFMAFSDIYGIEPELAARLSSSFGGGIGRMRLTCGAACGLFMLAGLENGTSDPANRTAKSENYRLVQDFAAEFIRYNGKLECQMAPKPEGERPNSPVAEERTAEYYKVRPCALIVENACRIFADYLKNKNENNE